LASLLALQEKFILSQEILTRLIRDHGENPSWKVDLDWVKRFRRIASAIRVEWILSAAEPRTLGEELPSNAIKFSGTEGFRQLALYFRDRLHAISGDLTGVFRIIISCFRLDACDSKLGKRFGWHKRISLPKSLFRARKLLNAKSGSRGPWSFKVTDGGVL
jgi:hypothetical protein